MPKKNGRPLTVIDWDEFDKLCHIQCTLAEVALWFNCDMDTIEAACKREKGLGFSEYYEQKRGRGRVSLRRKQFQLAIEGNVTMLIWLGKQYLGQSDKSEDILRQALIEPIVVDLVGKPSEFLGAKKDLERIKAELT